MKKLNVAIIGLGYIGESHIEAVHRLGFCNLYGVYDANMETAKAKSEYYGIPKCYNSIEELLADPNVDAVHNCTPTMLHHKINCQILEAGKHLFSEKPLCTTKEEAEELIAVKVAANKPTLLFLISFPQKYITIIAATDGIIDEYLKDKSVSGANNNQNLIYK